MDIFVAFSHETRMIDLQYYSPEEIIENSLFFKKRVSVTIKRDDLIHPFISGNKWRKLKYSLRKALSEKKDHLITFGGAYSNHLLATACVAAKFGFRSTAFVRGEVVENDTLMLCRLFGMMLIFVSRDTYRDKATLFKNNFADDPYAYFIDEGGSGDEAIVGCAEIIEELDQPYDHIFCASGTGATAAGILKGIQANDMSTIVHSVPVLKVDFIRSEIEKYGQGGSLLEVHSDYHFGGYAKTQPSLFQFMQQFTAATGILLDPVYTGKMMFALYDLIQKDYFAPGSKILAVHTGGLLGLLGMTEKINQSLP